MKLVSVAITFSAILLSGNSAAAAAAASTSAAFVPSKHVAARTTTKTTITALRDAVRFQYSPPPIPPPPPPKGEFSFPFELPKLPQIDILNVDKTNEALHSMLHDLQQAVTSSGGVQTTTSASWITALQESVQSMQSKISLLDESLLSQLSAKLVEWQAQLTDNTQSSAVLTTVVQKLSQFVTEQQQGLGTSTGMIAVSPTVSLIVSSLLTYVVVSNVLTWNAPPPPSTPYPNKRYDPASARAYFDQRLFTSLLPRALYIATQSLQFAIQVFQDQQTDKLAENEFRRGQELAELLTRLGPSFIKIGQSLSIRTDLLSPAYIRGLSKLQDQVPPFDSVTAQAILEQEWGRPLNQVIEGGILPDRPIAAASLGQVYKATLKGTNQLVAIKVQRPNISEQIALDMHLLREMAPVLKRLFNLNTDTVGTVDAWGAGFVDELDYQQEARNAQFFQERIQDTPLKNAVLAPAVVDNLTTRSVLVSEWIDGERLDRCSNDDVTVLCSVAMNTYLTMLLDEKLGVLHADPHPGNILRTPEGKLCILDWGMVTRLDTNLQLTLIEHVAHLTSADYAEIPRDLLLLDFIPASKADLIEDSGVVDVLANIYGQWQKGGGAAAINVNDVIQELQDLTSTRGNLFQIPPYFAYIAKSFSVLEGIGISNDPNYSIINECLPYVSQRLLTDTSKMGPALSTFIFGPEKSNPDRIVDYKRVQQLAEGFGEYTTSVSSAMSRNQEPLSRTQQLESASDQILDIVFTEKETPLQEIVIEQLAKITASSGRYMLTQVRERSGMLPNGRSLLGTLVDPLGLWRSSPLFRMNELDEKTVETTRKLLEMAQEQIQKNPTSASSLDISSMTADEYVQLAQILTRKVWARRMGVVQTGNRFVRKLMQLTAEALENGQRDSRIVPPTTTAAVPQLAEQTPSAGSLMSAPSGAATTASTTSLTTSIVSAVPAANPGPQSERLLNARRRLELLTQDEDAGMDTDTTIAMMDKRR